MQSNGLGLFVVKKIIEELGGKIAIKSKVGLGSVLTFEMPYQKVITPGVADLTSMA